VANRKITWSDKLLSTRWCWLDVHLALSTVAQTICPTVQQSGTSIMSYCATQWDKHYVPLFSTVAQATCPTLQHSGTYCLCHCAAEWHKQRVLLCWSSENAKEREWIQHCLLYVTSHSSQIKNTAMSVCHCFSKWLPTRHFRMHQ
jgi:hypothetical protein